MSLIRVRAFMALFCLLAACNTSEGAKLALPRTEHTEPTTVEEVPADDATSNVDASAADGDVQTPDASEHAEPAMQTHPAKVFKIETKLDATTVNAGSGVNVQCKAFDADANEIPDSQTSITISPENAQNRVDGERLHVEHAGDYEVVCQHDHAMVKGAKLKVRPALPATLKLTPEPFRREYAPGEVVIIHTTALDAYENPVPDAKVELTPGDGVERVEPGSYRLSDGNHSLHGRCTGPTYRGRSVEAQLELTADGGPPRIVCDSPRDGAQIELSGDSVMFRGRVADNSGIERVELNGQVVMVKDGAFEQPLPVTTGMNFVEISAVDGVGVRNLELCSFVASRSWSAGQASGALLVELSAKVFDDGDRGDTDSIADLLQSALQSAAFHAEVDAGLQQHAELKPSSCDATVLGGCVLRSEVRYVSWEQAGPASVALALADGGFAADVTLHDVRLRVQVRGMATGVNYDSTGWVTIQALQAHAAFELIAAAGRPRVMLRDGSVQASLSGVNTDFSNADGAVIDLVAKLFNGSLRAELTDAIQSVVSGQLQDAVADVLAGLDVSALGTTAQIPKLSGGGSVSLQLGLSLEDLESSSKRLRLVVASRVDLLGATQREGAELGVPAHGPAPAETLSDAGLSAAIHEALTSQLMLGLWRGGWFDIDFRGDQIAGLPREVTGHLDVEMPPVVTFADERIQLSAGAIALEFEYPTLFGEGPVRARVGVRLSAPLHASASQITLGDVRVDELRFGTSRSELFGFEPASGREALEKMFEGTLGRALASAAPSLPVPSLAMPAVLRGSARISLGDPHLEIMAPRAIIAGELTVQ